jgi:hypothetical protein
MDRRPEPVRSSAVRYKSDRVNRAWYRIALAHPGGPPMIVVAPGEHLGEALATAASRVKGAWPVAVAPAHADEVPLGEAVRERSTAIGKGVVVDAAAAIELPPELAPWPSGVIPSLSVPAHRLAAIRPGWIRHADDALVIIEAQVAGDAVGEAFLGLVERLPVADNLEVRVLDHHDGGGATEVWLTPRLDVKKAIRFLDDHDVELIDNGHVELSLYLRKERSTLRLTEHKTIVWLSEEADTAARFLGWLGELDTELPALTELVTVADAGHFHYRPPRSSERARMLRKLASMKLRRVSQVP